MSRNDLLVICRPASEPDHVQKSLESAGWTIHLEKRVQGFGQAPGLLSGTNQLFVLSVNKDSCASEGLEQLAGWLETSQIKHVYVPESLEEHEATLAKLLPPTPTEARGSSPLQHTRPESDRKFTFDESSTPLTRSAVESLPASLDEQLIRHDSLSHTTQSLELSGASENHPDCRLLPSIEPRLTKAAALRMGLAVPHTVDRRTSSVSADTQSSRDCASKTSTSVKSLRSPTVEPRQTRASALRAGGSQTPVKSNRPLVPRHASGISSRSDTSGDYPGYKRASLDIQVASTAEPAAKPRTNRAAALRAGTWTQEVEASLKTEREARRRQSVGSTDNTPGYKRSGLQVDVKSTKQPAVAPRMSRAAALRMGLEVPSSKATPEKKTQTPLASRTNNRTIASVNSPNRPAITPRPNRAAELRAAGVVGSPSTRSPVMSRSAPPLRTASKADVADESSPVVQRKKATGSLPPPPSIEPRGNRSAQLRAANKGSV